MQHLQNDIANIYRSVFGVVVGSIPEFDNVEPFPVESVQIGRHTVLCQGQEEIIIDTCATDLRSLSNRPNEVVLGSIDSIIRINSSC